MASVLQAQRISKRYGTKVLFEELDLNINEGEKIALIAPNGTGKTSLLKIIAGIDTPDFNSNGECGTVQLFNTSEIAYLEQDPAFESSVTIYDHLICGTRDWQHEIKVKQVLSSMGLNNLGLTMGELSGGERKRVAIAGIIIKGSNFIILDEPTNHLDLEIIEYLEEYLKRSRITLLMVTHDRYFLDRVCTGIIELEGGKLFEYEGNYSYFLEKREERIRNFNTTTERARNLFRTELEWMRRMPQARATKAKYRIKAFYDIQERANQKVQDDKIKIDTATSRLGKKIINCKNVCHSWGDLKTIENFTYNFSRGEKLGLVGANGVGKSTFLDIISGMLQPVSGVIEHGETVVFGYYRQNGLNFDKNDTVIDAVRKYAEVVTLSDGSMMDVGRFLTRFLFPHSTHNTKIEKLSGGEKRRLYLVTVLMQSPNFLILDEPTNDLDIMTLNILEEYLESFAGCVIVVSHDRFFLDKIAQHIFVFEGDGLIKDYVCKYSEYRRNVNDSLKESKSGIKETKSSAVKRKEDSRQKLSFKERRELEFVEKELQEREREKITLESALNSGELSPEMLIANSQRYSALLAEISEMEHRWLELSDRDSE